MGIDLLVLEYSILCCCLSKLNIKIWILLIIEVIYLVVDFMGVKVYGKGEWKIRIYGVGLGWIWCKFYLGVNEVIGEIDKYNRLFY